MNRGRSRWIAGALALSASAAGAQALSKTDAAFSAALLTPAGALPTVVRVHRGADSLSRVGVDLRYGKFRFDNPLTDNPQINAFGVGAGVAVMDRLQVTGVIGTRSCRSCQGTRMGSLGVDAALWRHEASDGGSTTDIDLLANAGIGASYGDSSRVQGRTFTLAVPLTVGLPQNGDSWFTLFFSPATHFGYLNDGRGNQLGYAGGDGSWIASMAAGVAFIFPFGLGVHGDVHRFIVAKSPTQMGFALSWSLGPQSNR